MIWSEAHVENTFDYKAIAVKGRNVCWGFFFLVGSQIDSKSFQWTRLNSFFTQPCWISNIPMSGIRPPQRACLSFIADESAVSPQACPFLPESKAQISCVVCFFPTILCGRHCTGPSSLINTSRREWLFLKMWRSRTCQFMPLYECFGMTACSASQCFCSSSLGEMLILATLWAVCLRHLGLSGGAEGETALWVSVFVSPSSETRHIKCPQISNSIAGHKTWHLL